MNKKNLKELIKSDIVRYGKKNGLKAKLYSIFTLQGYNYMKVLRKTNYYKNNKKFIRYYIYRQLLALKTTIYGVQIPYYTNIGKGIYIGHCKNVTINGNSILGNNINLSPGVTIGMTNRGENKGAPKIGNSVWIGTNAVIVGGITIGDNVMIAPNAFVNFNVPNNSLVIGNPGIIHYKENATESYIENTV